MYIPTSSDLSCTFSFILYYQIHVILKTYIILLDEFFIHQKIIALIMFAGERKGLGTRLLAIYTNILVLRAALPRSVTSVSECHVSRPQVVELPQGTQAAVDGMTSLHTHQRSDAVFIQCRSNVAGAGGKLEGFWILLDE